MAKKNVDISNKAVVAMLVLVVLVSVVSLGSYMNALDRAMPVVKFGSVAKVSVGVAEPLIQNAQVSEKVFSDSSGGKVSVIVI